LTPVVSEAVEYLYDRTAFSGGVAIVLGSGLGGFVEKFTDTVTIAYTDIPGYPQSTVVGHSGEFVVGRLHRVPVIAARGRFHLYEGYDYHTVTLPIRLFHKLGVSVLILTNAAGSLNPKLPPGSLMVLTGHRDCTFRHSPDPPQLLRGDPFHPPRLIQWVRDAAAASSVALREGVYCWTLGPAYETPAEIDYFRQLGGDAVGMSTVPELQAAAEFGLPTVAISAITNYAAGITKQPLTHEDVIETADRVQTTFTRLLTAAIQRMGKEFGFCE
jgi:purine-nucleoside phosphorylase